METYPETCSIVKNELECTIECSIEIYTYVDTKETNIDGVWVHCGPVMRRYNIKSIIGFREQEKSDTYKNWVHTISDNTEMPTEWCMMEYLERGKGGIQIVPVVGTVKGLTKKYNEAFEEYAKKYRKMCKNEDKIRKFFDSL